MPAKRRKGDDGKQAQAAPLDPGQQELLDLFVAIDKVRGVGRPLSSYQQTKKTDVQKTHSSSTSSCTAKGWPARWKCSPRL